ncbi:putative polyketide synthase [Acetobacter cibinongensis]|uniref:Polyketide synthase n=1 Tax=Acetobacter cibinongensis TaxID=146475 RepID=A0A0D6N1G5_9PROT|nr:type I polyketide synthase [Acetobacter cibinongensis]GAN59366.1 polyketide synthase [Acetobacter cibinongensis]GBQ13576.1 polyketide synthase [Acetobacter cibinongensis NRIC 0482]GEL59113.1 putative polyketide synthase [Acetobacter cibinongensis]
MNKKQEFAIIGTGLRFPENITTLKEFWVFLNSGQDASRDVPKDRWSIDRYYDPGYETPGKTYMRRGSFLTQELGYFEPQVFGISPREATLMDVQQRLLLEVAWEAFESAGIIPARMNGSNTGVFIGSFSLDWLVYCGSALNRESIKDHFSTTAASATMLSARLAHVFGLCGPCLTIDTACSSSLVAIHNACLSLSNGECDVALAGGVNFIINPQGAMPMSRGHFLAKDGRSKSFSADADGYGRGEGAALLIIKRLEDAVDAKDPIMGVICKSGVNHDGRGTAITVPNGAAQEALIKDVLRRSHLTGQQLDYVEAHGTGTPVGDPIETAAIGNAIAQNKYGEEPLIIGSVKANIGHLEAAAGVAGVLKTLLCLEHKEVPAQVNIEEINPNIECEKWNIHIPQGKNIPLSSKKPVLYAGVNSFGYGGTNSMVIMRSPHNFEAKPIRSKRPEKAAVKTYLLPLSSTHEKGLVKAAQAYTAFLQDNTTVDLHNVCYSAAICRTWFQHRAVILADSREELLRNLSDLENGTQNQSVVIGRSFVAPKLGPIMVFSGMGSQWEGMGKTILATLPANVRLVAEAFDATFQQLSGWSLLTVLTGEESAESPVHKTEIAQPAICLLEILVYKTLAAYGVCPSAIVGHSVGEVAAAYCAGALMLQDTVRVIYVRSQLQARLAGSGTMLAIGAEREKVEELIQKQGLTVSIAAINSLKSCTVSGVTEDLKKLEDHYGKQGVFVRMLNVEVPYHSTLMENIQSDMYEMLADLQPIKPEVPLYSTVTGKKWDNAVRHDAEYWYKNSRNPVEFFKAISTILQDIDGQVILEIGAHPVLLPSVKEIISKSDLQIQTVHSLRRNDVGHHWAELCLARLAIAGAPLDWLRMTGGQRVAIPYYAWHREYYWSECQEAAADRLGLIVHPLLGLPMVSATPRWRATINQNYLPWLPDHVIENNVIFPAAAYMEAALAVHFQIHGTHQAILKNFEIHSPILIENQVNCDVEWSYNVQTGKLEGSTLTRRDEDSAPLWRNHVGVEILTSSPWIMDERKVFAPVATKVFDKNRFYTTLAQNGLQYGEQFQVVEDIATVPEGLWAKLSLTPERASQSEEYALHPALLDGAFQLIAAAVFEHNPDNDYAYVPVSAERLIYHGQKNATLTAIVSLRAMSSKQLVADVQLYDESGHNVLGIDKLICKAVPRITKKKKFENLLYKATWKKAETLPLLVDPHTILAVGGVAQINAFKAVSEQYLLTVDTVLLPDKCDYSFFEKSFKNKVFNDYKSIVFFGSLEHNPNQMGDVERLLACVQAIPHLSIEEASPRLCVITTAGQDISLGQSALRGFARGMELERSDLRIKIIEVEASTEDATLASIGAEIIQDDCEDHVLIRSGERLVARVVPTSLKNENTTTVPLIGRADLSAILKVSDTGSLDKLYYEVSRMREPLAGEVSCQVLAAALNFKDVLKAMNLLPDSVVEGTFYGHALGMEAVVRILDVGAGVEHFVKGKDYIVAAADCFATSFTADAGTLFAIEKPASLSASDAATLPVAFLTAWYGLSHLARLQAGETVLIHSASGGVGLAAIQVAKMLGATVFATAGTEEKRDYLRNLGCTHVWSSRTLEFADEIRAVTQGRGVDVVLNSLSGEAQAASLACVASLGRFVEIGKRDIIENSSLAMRVFNENISFFSVDLDRLLNEKPQLIKDIFSAMANMMSDGSLQPLPSTVYPAGKTVDAFRYLSSTKHIGKVVIDYTDLTDVVGKEKWPPRPHIDPQGAYLITGGFGGLGLEIAEWLITSGATYLVLTGRKKTDNDVILNRIKVWRDLGYTIEERYFDIADKDSLKKCLSEFGNKLPALKGVFHCACVFDDALLSNITPARLEKGFAAKAIGAHHLDVLTRHTPLDFFVLFSSVTTMTGNIGQSVYIAANEVLNQICENRHVLNLAGLSLNLGPIDSVGILTRNQVAADALRNAGMNLLDIHNVLRFLPDIMEQRWPQITVADIDWEKWFRVVPLVADLSRFTAMHHLVGTLESTSETMLSLLNLPEEKRLDFIVDRLKAIIAKTLHLQEETIEDNARLSELGLDSLAGVELQTGIRVEFGVEVSAMMLAKDDSIRSLAKKFYSQIQVKLSTLRPEDV